MADPIRNDVGAGHVSQLRANDPAGVQFTAHTATSVPVATADRLERAYAPQWAPPRPVLRRRAAQWLLDGAGWLWVRPLIDFMLVALAVVVALGPAGALSSSHDGAVFLALPAFAVAMLYLRGQYRTRMRTLVLDGAVQLLGAVTVAAMAVVVLDVYANGRVIQGQALVREWLLAMVAVVAGRAVIGLSQRWARSRLLVGRPALIVGAGIVGTHVARRLETHPDYGLRPVGFLDFEELPAAEAGGRSLPVLGRPDELERVIAETGAEHVIIAFSSMSDEAFIPLVRSCDQLGVRVTVIPRLFETLNGRIVYESFGGLPVMALRAVDPRSWRFLVKHALDRVLALALLVLLAPPMLALALAIRVSSPGPILFRQRRVGRDGTDFDLFKFRTMRDGGDGDSSADFMPPKGSAPGGVEGEDRRTRFGRLLRRTSIDELPQLINVLRGEMSLVGPRPERPEFVELFGRDVARYGDRHRVKSGITGWAQVHGLRGQSSLADRVEWDNYYIAHWSVGLDLKILLLTALAVFQSPE